MRVLTSGDPDMTSLVTQNLVRFPATGGQVISSFVNLDVTSLLVTHKNVSPFRGPTVMMHKMMDGVGLRCCSEARGTSDST